MIQYKKTNKGTEILRVLFTSKDLADELLNIYVVLRE